MTAQTEHGSRRSATGARPEDLAALSLVGSPTLDPGGTRITAAVQTVDPESPTYRSALWSFAPGAPSDAAPGPLAAPGPWSDTAPVYAPDGMHVAFLSNRDGRRQVYVVATDSTTAANGGGAHAVRPLDTLDGQAVLLDWLDERRVAVVVERDPEDPAHSPRDGKPVTIDWLRYKSDGRRAFVEPLSALWLLDIEGGARLLHRPEGRVTCLAVGRHEIGYAVEPRHCDIPAPGAEVRVFSPQDGQDRLIWRSAAHIDALVATDASARWVAVAGTASDNSAAPPRIWSLDGRGSAAIAFPDADIACERAVLGDCRPSGKPALVQQAAGTDEILFLATTGDDVALFIGDPQSGEPRRLSLPGRTVTDFSAARGGRVAFCAEDPTRPVELHVATVRPGTDPVPPERVSQFCDAWVDRVGPVAARSVSVTASDGLGMSGLLHRAAGSGPGPLVVRVHGGPHLAAGTSFDLESQILVRAGYHVLSPNIRGSAGRGGAFRELSVGEWGGRDHTDVMCFVDWAVAEGIADPRRLYLTGGSYGGYLTNWALTRTDRFRAAVSERSVSNLLSKFGTSDNGFTTNRFEMGGADLFDDGALLLLERSPLRHAPAISTPLLLIHGEDDHRCPIEQSEQLFVALRRLGKTAKFVRFPGESHTLATAGRPDRRIARLELIVSWLDEHDAGPWEEPRS